MIYLKNYKLFENNTSEINFPRNTNEVNSVCKRFGIENYTINDDLSIDVNGSIIIYKNLTTLPIKFNKVIGNFTCSYNNLTTLEGSPKYISGDFHCGTNYITNLKYSPKYVGGDFTCNLCDLISLEGCPNKIGGEFDCSNNYLENLKFGPKEVGGDYSCNDNDLLNLNGTPEIINNYLSCQNNKLESLIGLPKLIKGGLEIAKNNLRSFDGFNGKIMKDISFALNSPLFNISKNFIKRSNKNELILDFIELDIIQNRGHTVYWNRMEEFCLMYNLELPEIEFVKEKYEVIT